MYLTGMLYNLPNVVLAAIVLVAVKGLVNIGELRHVWRVSRFEFGVSMVAFAGVLVLGILKGVIVAVLVSLLLLIRRAAHPHVAFLGRIPGTRIYSDIERNPDNRRVPGALLCRVEAALLYFNVEHVRDAIWQRIRSTPETLTLAVLDLSTSPTVDLAGARMLAKLHRNCRRLAYACGWWQRMRRCATSCAPKDWRKALATSAAGPRVADAVDEFQARLGA
jgi:SulP family sulfate permease